MKIIRDEECCGLMMIPLLCQWGIKRCNVENCREKPTTIVQGLAADIPLCGFCEKHFQEANVSGGANFTLEFNEFDAFKESQ